MRQAIALLLTLHFQVISCKADAPSPTCETALSACDMLTNVQADQITLLNKHIKLLEAKVEDRPLIPTWVYVVIGGAGGLWLGKQLR